MSRLKQAYFKVTGSKLSQLNHPNALTFLECLLTKQIFLSFHSNDHYLRFRRQLFPSFVGSHLKLWVIPLLSSIEFVHITWSSTVFTPLVGPLVSGENWSNEKSSYNPCQAPLLRLVPKQGEPPPRCSSCQGTNAAWCPEPLCPAAAWGPAGCSMRALPSPLGIFCLCRALQHIVGPP